MIIVKIQGGLGNQMFEYASGCGIAKKTGQDLKFDLTGLDTPPGVTKRHYQLDIFTIQPSFASRNEVRKFTMGKRHPTAGIFLKKMGVEIPDYVVDTGIGFNEALFSITGDAYLDGYWQSEKYFKHIKDDVKKAFTLKNRYSENARRFIELAHQKNSVAIQVRRGDYVTNKKVAALHGFLDTGYYQKAIDHISAKIPDPVFFAVSDDLDWVMKNIKTSGEILPVSLADYEQMEVMRACKHHIISNSSFGWWGAWLSDNPGKIVIAPQKWFAGMDCTIDDRLPAEWIKL